MFPLHPVEDGKHEEELLHCVGDHHWNTLPGDVVESPSPEILRTHLDAILCKVLKDDPS